MRQRGRVDKNQSEIVSALRKAGRSVTVLSGQGTGFPDLVVGYQGRNYLLEVKAPKGKITPEQVTFVEEWRGQMAIVRTAEHALEITENPVLYRERVDQ